MYLKKKVIRSMRFLIVRLFSEKTPPDVKYSEQNFRVGRALLALDYLAD